MIGMNPIPDSAPAPANIITEVRRVRDSCILLAGHRPYRWEPHIDMYLDLDIDLNQFFLYPHHLCYSISDDILQIEMCALGNFLWTGW